MLHPAWSCQACGEGSASLAVTSCGCPYHPRCLPPTCALHGQSTIGAQIRPVPTWRPGNRRELLREIQAAGLVGCLYATLCLRYLAADIVHLAEKRLVLVSPHGQAVYDRQLLTPLCD